ncbi:DUF72 domain-containing protein [Caballeronia grimmiae]|uniref:DUF72 domain-containing protein n=1 Tax=Caballeronia grimmiae TaxID=1071679 RepID=A0A069NUZ3_9BURK|nr:DUF72 domain-containing protein [Caballeronia grimmiae]KDR31519.1 hypothetical protein BG57_13050 [Caballeronia grimmiae]GGD93007.1 hypothetical protein GCM10010985_54710 [Caballeronia grimmiae]
MSAAGGRIRIGISGWRYAGWRGVFYPKKLAQARELEFASRAVQTVEINGSHYSLQTLSSYRAWHDATPADFVFSVKGPRYLTHMLRFRDETAIPASANFFASGVLALGDKLGPFLWQFPPNFSFKPESFERFLQLLPKDTHAAAALAQQHDTRVKEPWCEPGRKRALRHAVEIRHHSFCSDAFIRLLRKYGAALVVSDSVADWPYAEDLTSDFVYMRLHGTETLYGGAYSDEALDGWARRIERWAAGGQIEDAKLIASAAARRRASRDVYCYFDNDQKVQAPFDARRLMERLGITLENSASA